jgi:hypothetical protein
MAMLPLDDSTPTYPRPDRRTPIAKCDRCGDLGLWMTPQGDIQICPVIQLKKEHVELNVAARMIGDAIARLKTISRAVHPVEFDVVRCLSHFTSDNPCSRDLLITNYFGWHASAAGNLRRFHHLIEDLRREWLLPVASRKDTPAGYWIATDAEDFHEWVRRSKAAPITQLTTIHRLAKQHFKPLADQLELEFDAIKEAA